MAAPSMKERQACWGARDEFWKCLDEHAEDAAPCQTLRRSFEASCPQQWVSDAPAGRVGGCAREVGWGGVGWGRWGEPGLASSRVCQVATAASLSVWERVRAGLCSRRLAATVRLLL